MAKKVSWIGLTRRDEQAHSLVESSAMSANVAALLLLKKKTFEVVGMRLRKAASCNPARDILLLVPSCERRIGPCLDLWIIH